MKRDTRIDFLRALAIILIILAHANPPNLIMQLRVFDVPLMSMLLGMSFVLSEKRKKYQENYLHYLMKRFKRLIIPAWIFLTIFFSAIFIVSIVLGIGFPYQLKTILSSYTLISGIGYVWIIRIFFTIAVLSPVLYWVSKKIRKLHYQVLFVYALLCIQYILCITTNSFSGGKKLLFEQLIATSFAYSICALVGIWIINYKKDKILTFSLFMFVPFLIMCFVTSFTSINSQKYPPTPFFLLYGLSVSLFLLAIISTNSIGMNFFNNSIFKWISNHSLELYYWHIFPIFMIENISPNLNWSIKLTILLVLSFLVTYLQVKYIPGLFELNFNWKSKKSA